MSLTAQPKIAEPEAKKLKKTQPDVERWTRLSVDAVKVLAETRNIAPNSLTVKAWSALAEDVNFRLRQVTQLASKFASRHKRGHTLTSADINAAVEQLGLERIYGHCTRTPPKVYHMKESGVYAANDGVVDVVAFACSSSTVPEERSTMEMNLIGCGVIEKGAQTTAETLLDKTILTKCVALFRQTSAQMHLNQLFDTTQSLVKDHKIATIRELIDIIIEMLTGETFSPTTNLTNVISSIAYISICCTRVEVAKLSSSVSPLYSLLLEMILNSSSALYIKWSATLIEVVAMTVNCLIRNFNVCSTESLFSTLGEVFDDTKSLPEQTILCCTILNECHRADFYARVDCFTLLQTQYTRSAVVFDCVTPVQLVDVHDDGGGLRVAFRGVWKKFAIQVLNLQLRRFQRCSATSAVEHVLQLQEAHKFYKLAVDIFGDELVPFIVRQSQLPYAVKLSQFIGEKQSAENDEVDKVPRKVVKDVFWDRIEQTVHQSCKPVDKTASADSTKSTTSARKPRRRRAQDVFDIPRAWRNGVPSDPDMLFIFHDTNGRQLSKSTTSPATAVTVLSDKMSKWAVWLNGKNEDNQQVEKWMNRMTRNEKTGGGSCSFDELDYVV